MVMEGAAPGGLFLGAWHLPQNENALTLSAGNGAFYNEFQFDAFEHSVVIRFSFR
jgi:hypothetical protein